MEIDNISNYINYKLHEHKTNLIIFINDDYETKKLKTKQYIYKNRKLIIFGFIIAVLLAYITHLENNCNYQPHKQYGGNDSPKEPTVTTEEGTKPEETKTPASGAAGNGGTKPEGEGKKEEGTKPEGNGGTKPEGNGQKLREEGGPNPGEGSMLPSGKEGKKGSKSQPRNRAADKAAKKQGMGFLSGFKNINVSGGAFSSIFGVFKSVFQFFVDRIKFILYLFLSLFIFALLLISPIVFMMVVVYYMVKFLLKRQSTL